MKVNGTLINYYFHCKRQCYLFGNRLNMEDNSEEVKIGRELHNKKHSQKSENSEIAIDNIKIDKLTKEYVTEIKKSDADVEAAKWQLIYYLYILKNKGIMRKGKLECIEKKNKDNKDNKKVYIYELTDELEQELSKYISEIEELLLSEKIPEVINKGSKCKKCAYYEYCYI